MILSMETVALTVRIARHALTPTTYYRARLKDQNRLNRGLVFVVVNGQVDVSMTPFKKPRQFSGEPQIHFSSFFQAIIKLSHPDILNH